MKNKIFLLIITLYCSIMLSAQQSVPMDSAIRYGKLDNGLTYYIRDNVYSRKLADFYLVQNLGSINEDDNQSGLAHFLEHMAFNGTKNFPDKEIINYMQSIGLKFGKNVNASTSIDKTIYRLSNVPVTHRNRVDSAILILHDWSGFISLHDDEINKERGVVLEEWRTRETAGRRMRRESNELLYAGSQYANRPVIGDTSVIKNFTPDNLRAFYKKWSRPDLQAVIIVGDIDVDYVEKTIRQMFSEIPKPKIPTTAPVYAIPDNKEPIVSIVTDPEAKVSSISILYKQKSLSDSLKRTVEILDKGLINTLISSMIEDRFKQFIAEPASPFAYGSAIYRSLTRSTDALKFSVIAKDGKEKIAFDRLTKEIESIKRYGFIQSELDRAIVKKNSSVERLYNTSDNRKNNSYVKEYIRNFISLDPIPGIAWECNYAKQALKEKINLDLINTSVQSYFTNTNIVVDIKGPEKDVVVLPTAEEVSKALADVQTDTIKAYTEEVLNEPLMSEVPKSGSIVEVTMGDDFGTVEWKLSNGIKVILRSKKSKKDKVLLSVYSQGGVSMVDNVEDLPSAKSAAQIVGRSGFGNLSQLEINRLLAGKRVGFKSYIKSYEEGINGSSSVKDLETLLQLTYLAFTAPRKDSVAFATFIEKQQTLLANAEKDPNRAFRDTLSMISSNNSARTILYNMQMIEKIDLDKAYKIYKQRFANPADFTFILVGPFNLDSIKPLIMTYIGGLNTTQERESWKDTNIRYPKGEIVKEFEKAMEVEKTSVKLIYSGEMKYNLSNNLTLDALANILKLRYTESIREDEGGSYTISVKGFNSKKPTEEALLLIGFDTNKEKADKLIDIVQKEIDKIQKEGVRADDLDKLKKNMLKRYAEKKKSKKWIIRAIKTYDQYGINLLTEYEKTVNTLSSESIQQSLIEILSQENRILVKMNPKGKQ